MTTKTHNHKGIKMKTIFKLGFYLAALAITAAAPMLVAGIVLTCLAIYHAMTWGE
jgi:hypothetical protein